MVDELITKSVDELSGLVKSRKVSPVELTDAVIRQTEKCNAAVNAYILQTPEKARAAAKVAEKEIMAGNYRGTLHGIPMAVKDIFYVKGEVTTMGSRIHKDFVPDIESTAVSKLRDAGAIFTGKLNMHEYAYGGSNNNPHFGPCHNPWDVARIPGGSSGGSGAALAADMTIASLGTDTAGSVRIPAASCGVVGLKPTHGKVSKYGVFPLSWSLDHVGPMTKTVKDAALLLEVISGYDEKDPTSVHTDPVAYSKLLTGSVKNLRIGVNENYYFRDIDSGVEELVRKAIQAFKDMGAVIVDVDIPELAGAEYVERVTSAAEASTIHHDNLRAKAAFGNDVRVMLEFGELIPAVDYLYAQQLRRSVCAGFNRAFERVDLLIAPTLAFTAPIIGSRTAQINGKEMSLMQQSIRLTGPADLTGLPAISLPCGLSAGLPVGLQLIGPAFKEDVVLNAAYAFEQTNSMRGRKPDLTRFL